MASLIERWIFHQDGLLRHRKYWGCLRSSKLGESIFQVFVALSLKYIKAFAKMQGISDARELVLWLVLAIMPMHLFCAVTRESALQLFGFGPFAVGLQGFALAALFFGLIPYLCVLKGRSITFKVAVFICVYAFTIFVTNLIPTIPSFF